MLLDKSGLRRRTQEVVKNEKKGGFTQRKKTPAEAREQAIQMALNYGIGYDQYKKEVDAIRASRIREKLESQNK